MDFKDIEFELYGNLIQMKNILSYYKREDDIIQDLVNCAELIKTKKYHVAVVGEFRRGKSSLINAMLGLKVLPADVTPTTATINRITFGTEPQVTICYKDGGTELIPIEELKNYVTKQTEEMEERALSIREAVVSYPTVICQNHIDIIDTPGLNDDESMTGITLALLKEIDVVIVAVSALSPFSEVEKGFVTELIARETISDVIFVVTFIDQVDEEDLQKLLDNIKKRIQQMTMAEIDKRYGDKEEILGKARRILKDRFKLFAVSSYQALQAFVTGNRQLLKSSRFPFFKEELYKLLTAGQSIHVVERVRLVMHKASEGFDRIYQEKFHVIEEKISGLQNALELTKRYYLEQGSFLEEQTRSLGGRLEELLGEVREDNWKLKAHFCRELYQVRRNDPGLIRQAIEQAAEKSQEQGAAMIPQLDAAVAKLSEDAFDILYNRRREFYDTVQPLTAGEITLPALEKWRAQAEEEIGRVAREPFRFTQGLLPNVPRLEHCNVIAHIEPVLVQSVEAVGEPCRAFVQNTFRVLEHSITVDDYFKEAVGASLKEQLENAQKELLVCQGNYELHQTMVRGLMDSTEHLWIQCTSEKNEG